MSTERDGNLFSFLDNGEEDVYNMRDNDPGLDAVPDLVGNEMPYPAAASIDACPRGPKSAAEAIGHAIE